MKELQELTQLNRTTIFRILQTLIEFEYIKKNHTFHYIQRESNIFKIT